MFHTRGLSSFTVRRGIQVVKFFHYSACKKNLDKLDLKGFQNNFEYCTKAKRNISRILTYCTYTSKITMEPNLATCEIDTPEFHEMFTPELKQLISLFEKYNYELRIAGGPVRDLLMNKVPHDIDLATTATPDEMKEMFTKEGIRMLNMKGDKHGTVTCRINDKENYEVTTLRIDLVTDGRHAEVEFTKNWALDSLRRDLTINSMFLDFKGTLYDHFDGRGDLAARRVRFVGDAPSRIQEDYLRILRYFRFYGRISENPDNHEQGTLDAIKDNMHGLQGISGERIWVEVKKIITGNHAASMITKMIGLGMASYIGFPEEADTDNFAMVHQRCAHLQPHHMTLLTAIFQNEEQVYALHKRVKMSNEELKTALFILKHREDDCGPDKLCYCQNLTCDSVGKEPKTRDRISELLKYWGDSETLAAYSKWNLPRFPVSGIKVLERGVPKGPKLAKTLNALRKIWKESNFSLTEDDLLDHIEDLKDKIK